MPSRLLATLVSSPWRAWLVVILLTLLLRAPALWVPVLDLDEAGHAVGALVWLEGGVPYVDYVDNKQPLAYAAFAAVFALCGPSLVAVHWLTVPWLLLTAWLVGRVARGLYGSTAAALAPVLFALASVAWVEKDMLATNTEILANLPLAAAFALALDERVTGRGVPIPVRAALVGFLGSTAALLNLKAALAGPALVLALAVSRAAAPDGAARRARRVVAAILGASLPLVATALYFHARGALDALVEWNILENLRYAGTGPPLGSGGVEGGILYGWPRLALFVAATLPLWVAAVVGARRGWRRPSAANAVRSWLLLSLGGALLGGRLYGHYFIQMLPPLAVLASGPLGALPGEAAGRRSRLVAGLAAGLLLPVAGFTIAGHARVARRALDALRPPLTAVTDAVRARTRPGDRVFVWGYWPQLYYPLAQAGRLPATRFVFPQTLAGYVPGRPGGVVPGRPAGDFVVAGHWAQFLADMERHPAELIVDTAPAAVHFWERYPMESSPALAALVESRYRREAVVEGVVLYRRLAGPPPPGWQP